MRSEVPQHAFSAESDTLPNWVLFGSVETKGQKQADWLPRVLDTPPLSLMQWLSFDIVKAGENWQLSGLQDEVRSSK